MIHRDHLSEILVGDVSIYFGGVDACMAKHLLNGS